MRMLILGAGSMAATHVREFQSDPRVEVIGACDVDPARTREFCKRFGLPDAYRDLDEALARGAFDAAANVTPDAVHHPTTMKLLAAGKHVFCEKPLAETHPLAMEMTEAAEKAGLVNMVNLTYRNVAQLEKARAMVRAGEIGRLRHVEASYRQSWLVGSHWGDWKTEPRWLWRLSETHGSRGVLGDVGIHVLDFAGHGAGEEIVDVQARLKTFDKAPGGRIGDYPLDANDGVAMTVAFSGGAIGVVHASRFMTGYANTLRLHLFGDRGAIELEHGSAWTTLRACTGDDVHNLAWRDVPAEPVPTNYRKFVDAIVKGGTGDPSFRRAADLQKLIDACYA
ncbi:MAG: Gfo/Idh/MocA family oxidoreductase [Bradyrhizobium sp.]|nr:Gfo/Idh/MocA family oxidoreductase [Bradyrhizobium sp.]MDE2016341.1 Gfo/Idh/MocA family oxidoreductase [Hyphomicrobiales bacterium]